MSTGVKSAAGSRLKEIGGALLDVFYPRNCVACAAAAQGSLFDYLCADCAGLLEDGQGAYCQSCGMPMPGYEACPGACEQCKELSPAFERGRTLGAMREPLRALVHALKYRRGKRVLDDIALLAGRTQGYLDFLEGAVLVPVPLHAARKRQRGYNQSELFARLLAETARGAELRPLLRRVKNTATQTRLEKHERVENMAGAFAAAPRLGKIEKHRVHVLVDDVFTTGSTLNAAARALRKLGVETVHVATIAHG